MAFLSLQSAYLLLSRPVHRWFSSIGKFGCGTPATSVPRALIALQRNELHARGLDQARHRGEQRHRLYRLSEQRVVSGRYRALTAARERRGPSAAAALGGKRAHGAD